MAYKGVVRGFNPESAMFEQLVRAKRLYLFHLNFPLKAGKDAPKVRRGDAVRRFQLGGTVSTRKVCHWLASALFIEGLRVAESLISLSRNLKQICAD